MITPPNAFSAALATAKNKRRRRLWVVAAIILAGLWQMSALRGYFLRRLSGRAMR